MYIGNLDLFAWTAGLNGSLDYSKNCIMWCDWQSVLSGIKKRTSRARRLQCSHAADSIVANGKHAPDSS